MRLPTKAPHIGIRLNAAKGFYWTVLPLALAALSLLLFAAAAVLLEVWAAGWPAALLLLALCFETFFLPYLLVPIALWLPTLLPWVHYDLVKQFGLDGKGEARHRILLGAMILLPGLPVLAAYDSHITQLAMSSWHAPGEILIRASVGTVLIFIILTAVLAIPDIGGADADE